ncbi:hypothetical protein [Kitasatospora sp. NPDC058478]|uniref:hypothetical protein n=1 Tax=unclassified Kitasatospora TaxID=2633591 RepID=UPI003657CAB1
MRRTTPLTLTALAVAVLLWLRLRRADRAAAQARADALAARHEAAVTAHHLTRRARRPDPRNGDSP